MPHELSPIRKACSAGVAGGEGRRARRRQALVAVPLVCLEAGREMREERVALAGRREPHVAPADLRLARPPRLSPGGAREQLRAEADAEHRHPGGEQLRQERDLVRDPGMRVGLIDVHRAAERDHGAVGVPSAGEVIRLGSMPHVELGAGVADRLGEHAGPGIALVADRKHPHTAKFRRAARGSDDPALNVHAPHARRSVHIEHGALVRN